MLVVSCGDDDDPDDMMNPSTTGSLTCKINGVQFTATDLSTSSVIVAESYGVLAKRLDIRGTGPNNDQIIVTVTDLISDSNDPCLRNDTWNGLFNSTPQGYEGTLGTYIGDLTNTTGTTFSALTGAGPVSVTSCDSGNKSISGSFEFGALNFANNDTVRVTEGVFTDVVFQFFQ